MHTVRTPRPAQRWRRHLPLLVAGLVALLCAASLAVLDHRIRAENEVLQRLQQNGLWASSQALQHATQFRLAMHRHAHADPAVDAEEVALRFDLLYSRIRVLGIPGDSPDALLLERVRQEYAGLRGLLARMEAQLPGLVPGDGAALARLEDEAEALQRRLTDINLAQHQARVDGMTPGPRDALRGTFLASAGLLAVAIAGLVLLLLRKWRHARLLLAAEEKARAATATAEQTLRVLVDALPAMVIALDERGRTILANEAHLRFAGPAACRDAGTGHAPPGPFAPGLAPEELAGLHQARPGADPGRFVERTMVDGEGRARTLLTRLAALPDAGDGQRRVVRIALDITERKAAEEEVRRLSLRDGSTGLPNRSALAAELQQALADAGAGMQGAFCLHALGLDRFRELAETLGRDAGERLLAAAVARLRRCLRQGDMLARLGDDSFAVLQRRVAGPEDAAQLAARLAEALRGSFSIQGHVVVLGCHVGTVLAPDQADTLETLLRRADIALHHARRAAAAHVPFSTTLEQDQAERRMLEEDLRAALANGDVTLAYQPKFDADGILPRGVEALARWTHATRGPVPPGRFVPLAEECGLACDLAALVLRSACRQMIAWRGDGLEVPVAVNLSALLFGAGQAAALVRAVLEETGAPAHLLEIEVTESALIGETTTVAQELAALRAAGVRIALDDFGTGWSSLSYLHRFSFDVIKIDRSFVATMDAPGGQGAVLVESVVRLAHALGAVTVAEGVETTAQLARLRALGCDMVQGFLLARPGSPDAVPALFANPGAARAVA